MSSTTAFCSLILRSTPQQPLSPQTLPAVAGSTATLSHASTVCQWPHSAPDFNKVCLSSSGMPRAFKTKP